MKCPPTLWLYKLPVYFIFLGGIGRINIGVLRSLGITLLEIFLSRKKAMRKNCALVLGAPAASEGSGTWR